MSPLFIQLSPHVTWQMWIRHVKWFLLSALHPSRLPLHSRDSCVGCWSSSGTHIKLGPHSCRSCRNSSADSAIGFQPDGRHPVSFNQLLNHTAARLGLKTWTCSHTLVWAANKLLYTGQAQLQLSATSPVYESWGTWAIQAGFETGSGVPSLEGNYYNITL